MKNLIVVLIATFLLSSCTSDNEPASQATTSINFTEVLTFEVDTLELDITSHLGENSIFITSSNDGVWPEKVIKYNLSNSTQTELIHDDGTESRQIEIVNNLIYSFSYNHTIKYDLNLSNISDINQNNWLSYSKATKYNNNILILSGRLASGSNPTEMPLRLFNTNNEIYNELTVFPNGIRMNADGIVSNDMLFMFGGTDNIVNYNEINIYNILDDVWSQESLPYQVYESFTSLYNNTILVAGNKESDYSNAFIGIYNISTNTYSELDTSLNLENITIRGLTVLNNEVIIAYADLTSPMPSIITIKVVKASLL